MTSDSADGTEWQTYWLGRREAGDEQVYELPGVESDLELGTFWEDRISGVSADARVLELACGAGGVIQHAYRMGYRNLTGLDISDAAIDILKGRFPEVQGVVSSVEAAPLEPESFDLIVSQFGFEYAGPHESAPKVASLLAPGGRFTAIVHMSEGAIAEECRTALQACEAFSATGFIPASMRVFRAQHAAERSSLPDVQEELKAALAGLNAPRAAIDELSKTGHALATHTLTGTMLMFQRRQYYTLEDMLDWLQKVHDENLAHADRMQGMLACALTAQDVRAALTRLADEGLKTFPIQAMMQGDPVKSVAWIFDAIKPES